MRKTTCFVPMLLVTIVGFTRPSLGDAVLLSAVPSADGTLWRTAKNTVRLTFDLPVVAPAAGQIEVNELLAGGGFGPDLSANGFTFVLESASTVLRLRDDDAINDLLDHRWYAIRNTGGWIGVTPFEMHYFVLVGDAEGDGTAQYADASIVNASVPCIAGCGDATRKDMNGDGRILAVDVSVVGSRVFGYRTAKPSGHLNATLARHAPRSPMTGSVTFAPIGPTSVTAGTDVDFSVTVAVSTLAQFDSADLLIGVDGAGLMFFTYNATWVSDSSLSPVIGTGPGVHPSEIAVGGFRTTAPFGVSRLIGDVTVVTTGYAPGVYTVAVDPTAEQAGFGAVISKLSLAGATEPLAGSANFTILPGVIYVDADLLGSPNVGTSWGDAYTKLQDALAAATAGNEIWVAEGTYTPNLKSCFSDADCNPGAGTCVPPLPCAWPAPREQTFQLLNGVALYGGFLGGNRRCIGGTIPGAACTNNAQCTGPGAICGGGETLLSQRDPTANPTILSGDLNGDDASVACTQNAPDCDSFGGLCADGFCVMSNNNADNSYHVVTGSGTDVTAVLDGFTISAGNANGQGGGMLNVAGHPTVSSCTFSGNFAGGGGNGGGGMYNQSSNPTLTGCAFMRNAANNVASGGGIFNNGSSPSLTDCSFVGNVSGSGGAIINAFTSNPTLVNCTFDGNAASSGGGMYNISTSSPAVTNCTFSGNTANSQGGGMFNFFDSSPTITNCTFSGNVSGGGGGGMYNSDTSNPTVTNCTFVTNSSSGGSGGGMVNVSSSNPTVTNCTFNRNAANINGGGIYNVTSSPTTVTNCTFSGNRANIFGGGMAIFSSSSPTVTNSVLWANVDDADGNGGGPFTDESAQIHVSGDAPVVNYSVVQGGWTGAGGGTGNSASDPRFVDPDGPDNLPGTLDDDLGLSPGSPAIDAGNTTALPLDTYDLDGDGNTSERISLDLGGNPRILDDPATADTGVPGSNVVDMGAYEFFDDCNDNGIPDICDLACGATDGPCDIPGCGTSQDIRAPIGVPDECVTTTGGGGTNNWSDGGNWPLGGGLFPDNNPANPSGVPGLHVTLDATTIFLDTSVEVDSLRLIRGARLSATQVSVGDLDVLGNVFTEGIIEVANNRAITVGSQFAVSKNGKYLAAPGAGAAGCPGSDVCASLTAASVRLEPGDCPPRTPSFGGEIALSGDMSLISTGALTVLGSPSPSCPANVGSVADAQGITPPPKFTVRNVAAASASSVVVSGAVDSFLDSSNAVVVTADFDNGARFPSIINWTQGTIRLEGPLPHHFEVAGLDFGPSAEGFLTDADTLFETAQHTNFSLGRLVVDAPDVYFVNGRVNTAGTGSCAEALYVDTLETTTPVVLHLENVRVYYRILVGPPAAVVPVGCGALVALCDVATPAVAETMLNAAGATVASVKNRFLSFSGGDPGSLQAVRVRFVSLPDGFATLNGTSAWVGLPASASELPGKAFSDPIGVEATFTAARLVAAPVYADWSTFGVVHVYDERIIPSRKVGANPLEPAVYEVQLVTGGCDVNAEASFSPVLSITNARWGDLASLVAGQFRAPDGNIDVTADVLAVLAKFSNAAGAPSKARAEMVGAGAGGPQPGITGKIEISDVLAVLSAFSGGSYTFPPPG